MQPSTPEREPPSCEVSYPRLTPSPDLVARLAAFAGGENDGGSVVPWADRLAARERRLLRQDLLLVLLEEPRTTGEPIDWREIEEILRDYAEIAGWQGALTAESDEPALGNFVVQIRPRDRERLAAAPAAVQRAATLLLASFLACAPTDRAALPRGQLQKITDRGMWQIDLPDGYRLRYVVDDPGRTVRVVYLGPHPADGHYGRERGLRARLRALDASNPARR